MSHTINRVNAVDLKTPAALAALARRFEPVVLQPDDTPRALADKDYFSRLAMPRNVEHDSGSNATYDVQSDNRFLANYIQYNIAQDYPEMNVKGHPMVSPLTLAGYCMLLFNAHLLGCDSYFRPTKSYWCKNFHTDQGRKDYFDVLLNCHVPTFMADFLIEVAPVYDARRTNHIFVPTLAGYSHLHDFGRSLPPQIWLQVHNLLATTSTRKDPDDYQDDVYELPVLTFNNQDFDICHYFGTRYGFNHDNWLNHDFESFFNPIVGRALTQKPTFGKLNITPQNYPDMSHFDIYGHFLVADDDNITIMSNFIGAISTFYKSHEPKSPKLGNILASLSGSLLFSHSIEPPTLPTWTGSIRKDNKGSELTNKQFAAQHGFLVDPPSHKGTLPWPTDTKELVPDLYRLSHKKFEPTDRAVKYDLFDPTLHVAPYILYFQPYDVNASALSLTIVAGIKIELAEIDGFTVPTEHPESSLDDNNSQYLQSAVRLTHIKSILSNADPTTHPVRVISRRSLDRTTQAIGFAIRSMAKNVLPSLRTSIVKATNLNVSSKSGFTPEDNHDDLSHAFTFTAGTNGTPSLGNGTKLYAWSSYRVIHKDKRPTEEDISMILSFRPTYGTNVTLSRSKNPSLLIPH
jgi:hypothetical protein